MAITDHFRRTSEAGFSQGIDPRSAQRQFNMSLGLVVILAVAIVGVALAVGIAPVQTETVAAAGKSYVQAPQIAPVERASLSVVGG